MLRLTVSEMNPSSQAGHGGRGRRLLGYSSIPHITVFIAVLLSLSCSTTHYRESADRETYGIIKEKSPAVPGMSKDFTIETEGETTALNALLEGLPRHDTSEEFLGSDGGGEKGASILSLEQAPRRCGR